MQSIIGDCSRLEYRILCVVILILLSDSTKHQASECLEGALAISEWTSGTEIEDFRLRDRNDERTVILLARDFVFSCDGRVNQWNIAWYHREAWTNCAAVQFIFYVFRQSDHCGTLNLVGSNLFQVQISENSDDEIRLESEFEVEHGQRLIVQTGDFIAVSASLLAVQCSDIRVRIAGIRNMNIMNTVYHGLFSSIEGFSLALLFQPCTALVVDTSTFPFITAAVSKLHIVLYYN